MNDRVGLQFGDFTLDVSERLLLRDGVPMPLTPKAFDLLVALAARPGRLITKDDLLKEVWPDSFVEESNLAYHVFALRRALGDTPDGEKYIKTIPKHGYRFVALVKPANGAGAVRGSPTGAKGGDLEQEKAVDLGPDESENRDHSGEALGRGEPRAANTVRGGKGASRFFSRTAALWFAAGACSALVIFVLLYPTRQPVAREPVKVEVSTGVRLSEGSAFAISPDGRRLVFAGSGADGVVRLWVRSLDESEARPLPGTEFALGGLVPPMFWSPDSRYVAFDAFGQLKKVDVTGAPPQTVCNLPALAVGGSWNQNGVILVGSPQGGIVRCAASGGAASIVTQPDTSRQEATHLLPWFLPDGQRFLYLSVSRTMPENSGIYVRTLDATPGTTSSTRILAAGFGAAYVPDGDRERGHLLFMRDGALFAQAFDPASLQLTGEPARIAGPVGSFLDDALFSVSRNGVLAFSTPDATLRLTWLDRRGNVIERVGEPGRYSGLALAPDGTRAAVVQHAIGATAGQDLWLMDLPSGRSSRFTFDARLEEWPVWSEDGRRIFFSARGGIGSLFEQSISGDQTARLLLETAEHKVPSSISRDGRFLLYTTETIATRGDVWVLPLTGARKPYPLIRRPFDQEQAQFSPDGRWVAYVSNESGRQEVLVRPFTPVFTNDAESARESVTVSKSGGTAPRWRSDGQELFFITPEDAIASVPVSVRPVLKVGSQTTLFQAPGIASVWGVASDGSRFLVMAPEGRTTLTSFSLIFNWQGMLDRQRF